MPIFLSYLPIQIDCDYSGQQDRNEQFLCASRSFMKLRQKHTTTFRSSEKVKQWYQIQEEWFENVKTDNNYFDDYL